MLTEKSAHSHNLFSPGMACKVKIQNRGVIGNKVTCAFLSTHDILLVHKSVTALAKQLHQCLHNQRSLPNGKI